MRPSNPGLQSKVSACEDVLQEADRGSALHAMASLDPTPASLTPDELAALATGELLSLSRSILAELRHREVIRSGNAPAGDYAELLVRVATGGELAPASQKSWDVLAPGGDRLQVKARVVTNPRRAGEGQLSVFRSWDFDAAIIVLFDDEFRVWRATRLPAATVETASRFVDHVKGYRVIARDALLEQGEDWTELLRQAADDD